MIFICGLFIVTVGLFCAILVCVEIGRRLGIKRAGTNQALIAYGPIENAGFALLGLLIAFTFAGAASRFDARRQLIIEEVNCIGTAYLRLQILPAPAQSTLKGFFKEYVRERLATYQSIDNPPEMARHMRGAESLQRKIWDTTIAAIPSGSDASIRTLLLTSQNAMFDIAATRVLSAQLHPPYIVYVLMLFMVLVCSLMAGIGMASSQARSWTHIAAFALLLSATIYVILDMEYPRLGLITVSAFDQALITLEKGM